MAGGTRSIDAPTVVRLVSIKLLVALEVHLFVPEYADPSPIRDGPEDSLAHGTVQTVA